MNVQGYCDERFAAVRDAFAAYFDEGEVGASFAATIDGKFVIDLWGGHRDAARSLPWERDTIANVYSTTKTMAALCALVLADRGVLDLHAPVTKYWPEYGQRGKEHTQVRHFLSHSSGVAGFAQKASAAQLCDWTYATTTLAAQEAWWEPGTSSGYHAVTQGYLIGEVVRRATGKSLGTFFREEIATPLAADFHIGVAPKHFDRIAELIAADPIDLASLPIDLTGDSLAARALNNHDTGIDVVNSAAWRRAEVPAANGHGNARSVVRAQTALANRGVAFGVRLLSEAGARRALEEQVNGIDLVLGLPFRWGMGYAYSNELLPMSPNPNAVFWAGAGGSLVVVDFDAHICFSYVMNKMQNVMSGSRGERLGKALYACL
jgi:CubicO group peptidase (beta-lactamase class C family)